MKTEPKKTNEEIEARKLEQEIADGERRYRDEICGDEFQSLDLGMAPEIDELND